MEEGKYNFRESKTYILVFLTCSFLKVLCKTQADDFRSQNQWQWLQNTVRGGKISENSRETDLGKIQSRGVLKRNASLLDCAEQEWPHAPPRTGGEKKQKMRPLEKRQAKPPTWSDVLLQGWSYSSRIPLSLVALESWYRILVYWLWPPFHAFSCQ